MVPSDPEFSTEQPTHLPTEWSDRHVAKNQLRQEIWARLVAARAVHGNPVGHIPNFIQAEDAAAHLAMLPIWQRAQVVKCNPDASQLPVRLQALQAGKILYMAVPRLCQRHCFVEISAAALQAKGVPLTDAASMTGALSYGNPVPFEAMHPVDLVVVGCVAVAINGGRTGKGAGFADLELAMLKQFGLIRSDTPIVTTVHGLQWVASDRLPIQPHDWPLDWIVTPTWAIATHTQIPKPIGINWDVLQPDQYRTIPILQQLRSLNSPNFKSTD